MTAIGSQGEICASIDHHPDAAKNYEDQLVKLHGLNQQESAAIHSAGVTRADVPTWMALLALRVPIIKRGE